MFLHSMLQAAAGTANVTPKLPDPTATQWSLSSISLDSTRSWPSLTTELVDIVDVAYSTDQGNVYALDNNTNSLYTFKLTDPGYLGQATSAPNSLNISTVDNTPRSFTFGDNGAKLYIVGDQYDSLYQYNLSVPWDPSTGSLTYTYDLKELNLSPRNPYSVKFNHNGTRMWVFFRSLQIGARTNGILQYRLSNAWNINTTTWDGTDVFPRVNLYYLSQGSSSTGTGVYTMPLGLQILDNGNKIYYLSRNASNYPVVEVTTGGSPNRLATSQITGLVNTRSQDITAYGFFINPAKSRLFVIGASNDRIYQYNINTPGDLSTAVYFGKNLPFGAGTTYNELTPTALTFSPDGSRMYFYGNTTRRIWQFDLSSPWELDSAVFSGAKYWFSHIYSFYETYGTSLRFHPEGIKFFILGLRSRNGAPSSVCVTEYTCSTPWSMFDAQMTGRFSVRSEETYPQSLYIRPDGQEFFIIGLGKRRIFKYSMGSAWSIATSSYSGQVYQPIGPESSICGPYNNIRVTGRTTGSGIVYGSNPYSDGSDMNKAAVHAGIVSPGQTAIIERYDPNKYTYTGSASNGITSSNRTLTCGFYIRLADPQVMFTYSREWEPNGLYFSPWGDRMYIVGTYYNRIHQYNLNIPWDITSATFAKYGATSSTGHDLWFNAEGTQFVIIRSGIMYVHQLSTPWEVDTINSKWSKSLRNVDPTEVATDSWGIDIATDGSAVFVLNNSKNSITKLTLTENFNFNTATIPKASTGVFNFTTEGYRIISMSFSADGRNLYTTGTQSGSYNDYSVIKRHTLSTEWNIGSLALNTLVTRSSFVVNNTYGIDGNLTGIAISDDGTVLWISNQTTNNARITRVPLSIPFNITGIKSPDPNSGSGFWTSMISTAMGKFFFKSDFTRLYSIDDPDITSTTGGRFWTYPMTQSQQISSSTHITPYKSFSPTSYSAAINSAGTNLITATKNRISRYKLASAWDMSTGAYEGTLGSNLSIGVPRYGTGFYIASINSSGGKCKLSPDGKSIYLLTPYFSGMRVARLAMTREFDLSSISTTSNTSSLPSFGSDYANGFCFNYDGTKLYALRSNRLYEYRVNSPWGYGSFTFVRYITLSVESSPQGIYMRGDGLVFYIVGNNSGRVTQFNMSIPFNLGTATAGTQLFLDSDKGGASTKDIVFDTDGTKMLILSSAGGTVGSGSTMHEYNLLKPFDLSTATWARSYNLFNRAQSIRSYFGFDVSRDGKKMIISSYNSPTYLLSYTLKA